MEAGECHYMLRKVNRLLSKRLFTVYASLGLSQGQPRILKYLSEHGDCIQKDLGEHCFLEPATVTNTLIIMERNGLVRRAKDPNNLRNVHVILTEKGKMARIEVEERLLAMEDKCCKGFSNEDKEHMLRFLEMIYNNLEEM